MIELKMLCSVLSLKSSMTMQLKCRRNRGVTTFLPPPESILTNQIFPNFAANKNALIHRFKMHEFKVYLYTVVSEKKNLLFVN